MIATAWKGLPIQASMKITATCETAMITQATSAARSGPSCAGRERTPIRRSPSIDLKSLSVMIPCAPTE